MDRNGGIDLRRCKSNLGIFDQRRKKVKFGKFRVKTELEQQIWSECTRLITNAIIFYNAYILAELLEKKEANGMEETDFIKAISPVAWRHINLYGVYEFHRKASPINVSRIINNLDEKSMGIHLAEGSRYLNRNSLFYLFAALVKNTQYVSSETSIQQKHLERAGN